MINYVKLAKYLLVSFLLFNISQLWANTFTAGKDYQELSEPNHVANDTVIEAKTVIEFFNPGCLACYYFEPTVDTWLKNKPKSMKFIRVPVVFSNDWQLYAKAYLLSEELFANEPNKAENFLTALFDNIHNIDKPLRQKSEMAALFQKFGVNEKTFNIGYNSIVLKKQLAQVEKLAANFNIMNVPTFIVAGRYRVDPTMAKDRQRLMATVDYLLEEANSPQLETQS